MVSFAFCLYQPAGRTRSRPCVWGRPSEPQTSNFIFVQRHRREWRCRSCLTQVRHRRAHTAAVLRSAGWAGWAGNLADGVIIIRRNRQPNPPSHNSRWHVTFVGFLEYYECYQPNCCSAFPTFPPHAQLVCAVGKARPRPCVPWPAASDAATARCLETKPQSGIWHHAACF